MTEPDDIDALAAEFVLGTLDLSERAMVAARRTREPRLDVAIEAWERRLSPLNALTPEVEPPRDLWSRIEAKLNESIQPMADSNIVDLQRRLARWRRMAVATTAIAASLLIFVGFRETARTSTPLNYVAVFQQDDALPAFLMSIDLETRQLSIRPVAAQTPSGKAYQLWIAVETSGGKPQSLGLVEDRQATRAALAAFEPAVVRTATFGVSLEPAGGSPTGQPTGPVFHAKLLQTTY